MTRFHSVLLGAAGLFMSSSPADAAKLIVGQGGLVTVQDAVDAALLNADPDDKILIPAGDYAETVVVTYGASGQTSLSIKRTGKGTVKITGTTGAALRLNGASAVTVENLTLESFTTDGVPALLVDGGSTNVTARNLSGVPGDDLGVNVTGGSTLGVTLIDCDFSGMQFVGFQLDSIGHRLSGCVADGCGFNGFVLTDQSLLCVLENCSANAQGLIGGTLNGVCSIDGTSHRFKKVTVKNGGQDGFFVAGEGHLFEKCSAQDNFDAGFEIDDAIAAFNNCSASGNTEGLFGGGVGALVRGGTYDSNTSHGVGISIGGMVISGVTASNNGGDGVNVGPGVIGARVTDSTFKKNTGEGLRVQGQLTWVEGNSAKGGDGLTDEGSGNDGRDNTVKGGATNDF